MLYLIEKNGKYALPYNVWDLIKEYTGIFNLSIDYSSVNAMRVDLLYGVYRSWFGRFIVPDYYDVWGHTQQRKWLLKNLVKKNNYLMTKDKYIDLMEYVNEDIINETDI